MPQTHRFIPIDNPQVLCYRCETPVGAISFIDLYGTRMAHYCEECAVKLGMEKGPEAVKQPGPE